MVSVTEDRQQQLNPGMALKVPCKVASTGVLVLNGEKVVDGVAVVSGDRVLVKDQANSVDNGIYVVSTGGWTRAQDFDGRFDATRGTLVIVNQGSSLGRFYRLTTVDNPVVFGTSAITFQLSTEVPVPLASFPQIVDTIAALKAIPNPAGSAVTYLVRGYYAVADGGGGLFVWNLADATADNGGTVIAPNAGAGRWNRIFDQGDYIHYRWFGAKLDDASDDTAKIQAAHDLVGQASGGQKSGRFFLDGPCVITASITSTGQSVEICGSGWGDRNDANPRRSYFRWDGAAGTPMLQVSNVQGFRARKLRFIGKSAAKPSAAINFKQIAGFPLHANALEDIQIGMHVGEADVGQQFTDGLLFDGLASNNAEFYAENIDITTVSRDGIHVGFGQSINLHIDTLSIASCGRFGLSTAGGIHGTNWNFNANACDLNLPSTDDIGNATTSYVHVIGFHSENSAQLAQSAGHLTIERGDMTFGAFTIASGKIIDASGFANDGYLQLRDFNFVKFSAPPANAFLDYSGTAGHGGYKSIVLDHVTGMDSVLSANTVGLKVLTGDPTDRRYVYFMEKLGLGSATLPRMAQNFIGDVSNNQEWDIARFDIPNLSGNIATPTQIVANQNDYNPSRAETWRLSSDAARNVTGIVAPGLSLGSSLKRTIINVGAQNITLQNQNAGSAAGNRIITGTGADVVLAADDTAFLLYDPVTARWRILNTY